MAGEATRHQVAVIEGDGVGPSLVAAALVVNAAAESQYGYRLEIELVELLDDDQADRLGPSELERLRNADAIFKGPAGLPKRRNALGTESGLLGGILRPALETYANVRPIRSWPGGPRLAAGADPIDYVIVRENVEGLYASRAGGARTPHGAADVLIATRQGTERIARHAFAVARGRARDGRSRSVTCVDKANVLPSHAFFRGVVQEVASDFPDVSLRTLHADAAGQALLLEPSSFDILVMENFVGDILSEVAAATVGGVGMQPSANVGLTHAYFEPAHGSAPALAGHDRANPIGQILTIALLLDHLGEKPAAHGIEDAVARSFMTGAVVLDAGGCPLAGTVATAEVIAGLVR